MDATGTPYIIAFVIDDAGVVLDGTSLWDAVVQANSSALRHSDLDGSEQLQREDLGEWTEEMLRLNREYGMRILGGCCGTDDTYLLSLVRGRGG